METAKPTRRVTTRVCWVILAAALAFAALVRWRLADMPLERDEGEYAYAGQLILEGIPPYSLVYNMKLPGVYLAYAGFMAVFGQTTAGIHLGLLVVSLATIVLLFFFTRELFDPVAGAVAAATYSILSTSSTAMGQAAHATHFVVLFGVAGVWVLWRALHAERPLPRLFAAGLLLGIALLMKQHAVFLLGFGGLAVLLAGARRRPFSWRWLLATCSAYVAGAILPYALVCLWLWRAGTFHNFWFWTVVYAQAYIEQKPLSMAPMMFWSHFTAIVGANWPLWALALVGVVGLAWPRRDAALLLRWGETTLQLAVSRASSPPAAGGRAFVFGFLLFSFLCLCPGFHFREHYFIVLLPCVAMLAGVGAARLVGVASRLSLVPVQQPPLQSPVDRQQRRREATRAVAPARKAGAFRPRFLTVLAVLLPTAALVLPILNQRDFFFVWSPDEASRQIYGANPFIECRKIADYLKQHTSPSDRVAVIGSEPEIFFYAQRRSATGYIYVYPLMESHPDVRGMQEEMIREIEAAKPEYLVIVNVPTSWLMYRDSDKSILAWVNNYTNAYFRPVGLIDILFDEGTADKPFEDGTTYKWGDQIAGAQPRSNCHLWVFQRKP
jgi:hypothetical protein